ncbi:AMP-binding protein [Streptomyces sudanensis]|uniref:AMP-binding protein n=1 Tax=Streptomyces sudanensis TaxID=436397 RepID=UPI0020CF0A4F|nr:AMP-binding protein [Streptomyces sudanensis]MCP9956922.1 AMP-binding protein [Streptomyces sudanensis]MCQ0002494.1 AMP-binding protein [Streptomyces sudanensis]
MAAKAGALSLPPWSIDPADRAGTPPALGDLLVAPALRWPDRTAIDDGAVGYTFAQLEQGAQAVAAWLTEQGVGAGDRVVVLAEKRAVMPVLAVAVWKCGAVYVPLDSAEPEARLRGLLTRLRPAAVITPGDRDPGTPAGRRLGGERLAEILSGPAVAHTTVARRPEEAAYIVFASGATGEPQGAEISVGALLSYFVNHNEVLRITPESRVLSLAPFHFDVSLEDTLLPLSLGAFVHQFRGLPAGAVMRAVIARQGITHLIAVTMLLTMITGDGRQITRAKLPSLELVMTGAQVCDPAVLRVWARELPETRLVQAFGPPEATIFSFTHEIGPEEAERMTVCPVGRPLRGVLAKIMRDGAEVHEPGVRGELWVGGAQVMRGYFDQPEETARLVVDLDGTRYFRTGDICSYDADGDIVLHRHDDERIVWLAGRRTHLNEVRRAALDCPGVDRAVAAVVRRGRRDVVALVVGSEERHVVVEVAERLRGLLPEYLRPSLMGWSPAGPAASLPERDDRQLIQQLTAAAQQSDSDCFALSADGAVETIDEVETCP